MTLNRVSAFRLLDLESLLIEHSDDSRLWHNNVLVPDGQISPMHLGDGDFIKIVIGHREGSSACDETDVSSFALESDIGESDSISTLQTSHQTQVFMPSYADVDPPSLQAVCISGSCDTFHGQPRTQSMNEPFSFFESRDSNRAREQPGRPPRVESPLWHQEIWDLLCDEGAVEMDEEGPIIYVRSFFISHTNTPINRVSRPLRFDIEHEAWEASARFMWEDFVDQQAPLELFIVHPDPPTTIFEGTVATVLVVQHPLPQKAAIVVTALPDAPEVRHARHVALSADPVVTQDQLVAVAEVQGLCNTPGCSTWIGSRELPADEHVRTHDGLGLQIKIPAQRLEMTQHSTDLIAARSLQAAGHHDSDQEDEHDELTMISLQFDSFKGVLSQTIRLLNTDPTEPPEYNVEMQGLNGHQRATQENPAEGRHLDELHDAWLRASPVFAVSVDEAAVTFMSWFVHSHFWTTCDSPRMLTLFPQRHDWDSQIRSLWRDRMQPGQPFEVSIVSPTSEDDSRSCNILIHQGTTNRHRGVMLSTFYHAATSQLYRKRALVVPSRISFTDLTRFADFLIECHSRTILCVGFFGSESLDDDRPIFPRQGAHLELHLVEWEVVPTAAGQPTHHTEHDDSDATSLMHATRHRLARAPRVCGIDLPAQPHESGPFQFQINAPEFVPGIPWDLHEHDEFVQDLFEAWNQVASVWEEDERAGMILVWFVDHQWPYPHAHAPRRVRLLSNLHEWRMQIWQAWQDCIVPGHELEYQLVTPHPHTPDRRIAAHVVVIQRPNEQWVTNIVTLFDERTSQTTVSQLAITTHEHILLDNLVRAFGIHEMCFGRTPSLLCHAWYRDLALASGAPIPGRSGMSINVLARPRPAPMPFDNREPDSNSLLTVPLPGEAPHAFEMPLTKGQHWSIDDHAKPLVCATKTFIELRLPERPCSGRHDQSTVTPPQLTPVPIPPTMPAQMGFPTFVGEMLNELQATMLRTDGEQQGFVVRVWYLHHTHRRMSRIARYLHLSGPPHLWQPRIVALWSDRLIPFEAIAIHLARPRPFRTMHEQHLAFDLIVSQGMHEPRKSGLISVFPSPADPTFPQFAAALSFRPHVSGEWLIRKLAFQQACQVHRCLLFHRWNEIPLSAELVHEMSNGDSFDLHVYRDGPGQQPPQQQQQLPQHLPEAEAGTEEGPVLLQLHSILQIDTALHNDSAVASDEQSIQEDPLEYPIRLIGLGELRDQVPSFVTIMDVPTEASVQQELRCFGHACTVVVASNQTLAVCIPESWPFEEDKLLLMFTDMQQTLPNEQSAFLTLTEQMDLSEVQLMSLLHKFGFEKAVIGAKRQYNATFLEVTFQQAGGTLESVPQTIKHQKPWPARPRGDRTKSGPMWKAQLTAAVPPCLLDLGLSREELDAFFNCDTDYLCRITEGLPLLPVTIEAIAELKQHSHFDRLVVYADGSSQSRHKHVAPALNEELDVPDAWCFVVLGETFVDNSKSECTLLGWHAHQVRCDPQHPWHIGAQHVGSAIAEREALTWAFIWRLGLNSCLPTVFRSDSLLTIGQAEGSIGPAVCDQSFQALRGCYQILKAALGDDVELDHVFGHLAEPWNELTDALAKQEAKSSFFLPRPKIDIPKLLPKIPFLWMIFDRYHGLPSFTGTGFDIRAPALPPKMPPARQDMPLMKSIKPVRYKISIATANVQSLGAADQGFAGKLDYLREQFVSLHLNLLGIQESRASEGVSVKQGVLRLCSGSLQGKWGVELWINLQQPFAHIQKTALFFRKQDFHVAHRDPRRLLVRIQNDHFQSWCLVAHAPQSGIAFGDRQIWWDETKEILHRSLFPGEQFFMCIDANAAPGVPDGVSVFNQGFKHSSGTPLLHDFLDDFELCLPITSAAHQGSVTTWTSPDDAEYTIDYVAIPRVWQSACNHSCVLTDFDLANVNLDHSAAAIDLQWTQASAHHARVKTGAPGYDRTKIDRGVEDLLKQPISCTWKDDVESQATKIAEHFRTQLATRYRKSRHGPKKPYVSDKLWQLRLQKIALRRTLRDCRSLLRREALSRIFLAWKQTPDAEEQINLSFNYGTSLRIGSFHRYIEFASVAAQLRKELQHSRNHKLQEVLQQIDPSTPASKIQQMLKPFKGPSNKLRQGLAPLPLIRDEKGDFCRTAEDALHRWITFFGNMEGGTRTSQEDQWSQWRDNLIFFLQSDLHIPVEEVPSLCDLEQACRLSAAGKATGLDTIPSEVCKYCPRAVALHLYSLMLKTCAHGQEALAHKGGILLPIWKGKQLKDQCSAFRSILLSSCLGKVMHKAVRTKQLDIYQHFLHHQQLGGRRGVPVTLGGHQVRAFQRLCAQRGQPSALLFVDLQEAFYRVLRPLVVDGPIDDVTIATMAARIDLDDGFLHDLRAALQQPCALEEAGIPSHLRRAIRALHTDTFFQLPTQHDQVVTQIGTRPGDSFADVIFGFLMAKVLQKFQQVMDAAGFLLSVPKEDSLAFEAVAPRDNLSFVGPCWMDDLCVCLTATTNEKLDSALGFATGVLLDIFKSYAMTPNLQPGKTAVLISPRGPGTNQWKRKMFGPMSDGCFLSLGEHHSYRVPIVTEYTHLGGKVHFSTKLRKEIKTRLGQAHQEFNKHRKLLYQNRHFPIDKKKELFQSLILSRLLFGSETWTFSDQKTREYLHGGTMGLLKRLLHQPGHCPISDEEVLYRTRMPSPTTMLRTRRLRYLGSLFAVGDTACWGLLNQDRDWLSLVLDDFRWLWHQLHHCCKLGDPAAHLPRWLEVIRFHRGYWKRLIRRATEHSIGIQDREYLVAITHQNFLDHLTKGHFVELASHETFSRRSSPQAFGCMQCQKACRSLGGEGAHMHRTHGEAHPVRSLMGSTQCAACLTEYYTMGKLKMHLIRSSQCRTTLIGRGHLEPTQPGIGSVEDTVRWMQWDNKLPPLAAEGPQPREAPRRDFDVEHPALYEEVILSILEVDTEAYETHVRRCIRKHPISWTKCRRTLLEAHRQCAEGFLDVDPAHMRSCMETLQRLSQADAWPFLAALRCGAQPTVPSQEEIDSRIEAAQIIHDRRAIPPPLGRERVFLHAFSGRRRPGDLQHYLEEAFARQADGVLLHVVSMDIVIDKEWGDARRQTTRDFWLRGALSGFVQGGLCGPPCETWSQARFVDLGEADERRPRPLRSLEWLWGLPSLSLREMGQVEVGNELLLFAIDLLICLARSEGIGVLEHPGEPADETKPSIWRLPIIQLLRQLPGFDFVDFAQGLLGAKSPKPTRFLTLNMGSLPGFLHSHRLCPDLPRNAAIGKTVDGQWATTSLKEYPPALNKALGESFAFHLLQYPYQQDTVIDKGFLDRCRFMHVTDFGKHYGLDYCHQHR